MMKAVILLIGDELLAGEIADANGPFFAEKLTGQGFVVDRICTVSDDAEAIVLSVGEAMETSRLVVVCGGLGPTSDDRTTEAVGLALGLPTILDEEQWERIRQIFSMLRGAEPPPGNEKQAMIPEGSEILRNPMGTAVGSVVSKGDCAVAVFPGPPKENQPMFDDGLLPWLDQNIPERPRLTTRVFRVFGLPESEVGSRLRAIERAFPDLRVGYQFRFPEILVKLRGAPGAEASLESASAEVETILAPHLYARGDESLPAILGRELASKGLRVVTAESCTAGLAAKLLTDTPGSTAWMDRGFVTYTNKAKEDLLHVPADLLAEHGAVSEPVALAMLQGALDQSPADVGFSITGIAGPDGGTADKPVGTVCIAWGDRSTQGVKTYLFLWDREYTRLVSAWTALHRLYLFVLDI